MGVINPKNADNREKMAFFNVTHKALRVRSGSEAVNMLLKSFRIAKELGILVEAHDDEFERIYGTVMAPDAQERAEWDAKVKKIYYFAVRHLILMTDINQHCTHVQIRKWVEGNEKSYNSSNLVNRMPIDNIIIRYIGDQPETEFRCFVFKNKIAAVSQLYFPAYFPFVESCHRQIKEVRTDVVTSTNLCWYLPFTPKAITRFHSKIESYLDYERSYSMDVALVPLDSVCVTTLYIFHIELN